MIHWIQCFQPVEGKIRGFHIFHPATRIRLQAIRIRLWVNRNDHPEWCMFRRAKNNWNQEIRIRLQARRIHLLVNRNDHPELCMFRPAKNNLHQETRIRLQGCGQSK